MIMHQLPKPSHSVWICLGLAIITFASYAQVLQNDFVTYDDGLYVTNNNVVKTGLTSKSMAWAFTATHAANWHPLTWLSHMLDCQIFPDNPSEPDQTDAPQPDPTWHHLTNLVMHICNSLLLFAVFKRMTRAVWCSAFVAVGFAVHPLHVESVAWIAERKDVLSTCFWLLTMAAYIQYVQNPTILRYLLILCSLCLGLMAKPMLVTLPFVLLLLDHWPLGRLRLGGSMPHLHSTAKLPLAIPRCSLSVLIIEKVPLFLLVTVASFITFNVQESEGAMRALSDYSVTDKSFNAIVSYIAYLGKLFWPVNLAVFYPHRGDLMSGWVVFTSMTLLLAISGTALLLSRSAPYLLSGWFWYLGTMVPVIGLVQVGSQAMADRYSYIPSIGVFVIVAWSGAFLIREKRVLATITLTLILGMTIATHLQVRHWHNSEILYKRALNATENNWVIHSNLGAVYRVAHRLDEAEAQYRLSLRAKPDYAQAHYNLGDLLRTQNLLNEAIEHLDQAVQIDPKHLSAHISLATALYAANRLPETITYLERALDIEPESATVHYTLAKALRENGKITEAIHHFEQSVLIKPLDAKPRFHLGIALTDSGRINEAINSFQIASQLKPDFPDPLNASAWIRATHYDESVRNPRKAIQLAKRAADLTRYQDAVILDTLAAAYAANGRFQDAITISEKALEHAENSTAQDLIREITQRLILYRNRTPFIQQYE